MPTYRARGVTAHLATCNLQASLTNGFTLSQGPAQRANHKRVHQVLSYAQKLPEKPIGDDGSEHGVVQFIGAHTDMPLYMVEAGEGIHRPREEQVDAAMSLGARESELRKDSFLEQPPSLVDADSSLTSLATTPTSPQHSFQEPSQQTSEPHLLHPAALTSVSEHLSMSEGPAVARVQLPTTDVQALVLDVDFSPTSFLPDLRRPRPVSQGFAIGMKVEVFLNGQLADVAFVNQNEGRRLAIQHAGKDKARFAGLRIHRQIEKPWTYSPDMSAAGSNDAASVWTHACSSYAEEAEVRGRNRFGDPPPSADFLVALANLEMPARLKEMRGMAVIDVVITIGEGRKYGPETMYLMKPTRLDDTAYTRQEAVSLPAPLTMGSLPDKDEKITEAIASPKRSPSTPGSSMPLSRNIDFAKELGLHLDPNSLVGSYENAHGLVGKSGRTLRQRLGDVKKMKSSNMDAELERLKDEFGMKEPASKKVKFDNAETEFEDFINGSNLGDLTKTISPAKLFKEPPKLLPGFDEEAVLAQHRIDMALEAGAATDGPLLRRIASLSPQRTPIRRTKASSLANSPASVPVKWPKARGKQPSTPQQRRRRQTTSVTTPQAHDDVEGLKPPPTTPTPQQVKGGPTKRTSRTCNTKEQSVPEALKAFEVPRCCVGSCVGFDEDENVVRQIGKARGGEFREETLLVGMRFVVI